MHDLYIFIYILFIIFNFFPLNCCIICYSIVFILFFSISFLFQFHLTQPFNFLTYSIQGVNIIIKLICLWRKNMIDNKKALSFEKKIDIFLNNNFLISRILY